MKSRLQNADSKDSQGSHAVSDSKRYLKDWSSKQEFQRIRDEREPIRLEVSELDAETIKLLEELEKAQEDSNKTAKKDQNIKGRNYDPREETDYKSIGDDAFACFYDRSIGTHYSSYEKRETYEKSSIEKRKTFWKTFNNGHIFERTIFKNLLKVSDMVRLTPGEVLLLSGDFYGAKSIVEVISFGKDEKERDQRFKKLYSTLKEAKLSEIDQVKKKIEELKDLVHTAIFSDSIQPSPNVEISNYKDNSGSPASEFSTLSKYTFFPFTVFHPEYRETCLYNFDHFGADAIEAYKAGHRVAYESAEKALNENNLAYLAEAFCQELFACRYLIDSLAAGHIRTPRRAIYASIKENTNYTGTTKLLLSSLLTKEMHDEDSRKGVLIQNKNRKYYEAFEQVDWTGSSTKPEKISGEACYFENEKGKVDQLALREMIVTGLFDIFYYYFSECKNKTTKMSALELYPMVIENEAKPLFQVGSPDGKAMVRKNVDQSECGEYVSNWSPIEILVKRKLMSIQQVNNGNPQFQMSEKDTLEKELQQLDSTSPLLRFFADNPQLGMHAKGILNLIDDYAEECHVTCRLM